MPVPGRIGRFEVVERIGGGAFASVWRAKDDALDSTVAIKVLSADWLDSADVHSRFLAEARMLRRAESDRVVRVHDIGELPDGRPYLVMTYGDRGTLEERISAGPLPWREAVEVAVEIGLALRSLHADGVLHRDVKPSNVLFRSGPDGKDRVLLGDLGLGKLLSEASTLTMIGGTPAYMAPEQAGADEPLSVRTDVYGLGALLYRTVTGRHPYDNNEIGDIAERGAPPRVRNVPAGLDAALQRALAPKPADRYGDVAEFVADLRRLLAPRRSRWLIPLGLLALAGVAAGIWYLSRPEQVEVGDGTRTISLRVPRAWAGELAGAGWDPSVLGLAPGRWPGLLVAESVAAFPGPADPRAGVFAGVLPPMSALSPQDFETRTAKPGCVAAATSPPPVAGLRAAHVRRCGVAFVADALLEVSGQQVWVQVKQSADDVTAFREVLSSVGLGRR
ncbi:serine/threonine-protein kinase [Allokutzneria albata]|uniref:non-specific serine/threonine protein kinase n=1 Tax=Allokutzneria albata TaxID=211114 RepID=A0A1G9R1A9_ALLAB|nr:serine/threonine-protein kinase [Allokutzneria albata]SDM16890.1 Serine/threonine protein kinase [Allokutzneria albata]